MAVKAPYTLLRKANRVQRNYEETKGWWCREVLAVHRGVERPARSPMADMIASRDRFARSFYLHSFARFQLTGVPGAIMQIAEKIGDPSLGTAAMSGQGGVVETRLADDAWRMARGELSEDGFIDEYVYRGPNEGNACSLHTRAIDTTAIARYAQPSNRRLAQGRSTQLVHEGWAGPWRGAGSKFPTRNCHH